MSSREPKDSPKRRQALEPGAIANELSARAVEVTTPIYQLSAHGDPAFVGTGVLLQLARLRFLVTAGHVLDVTVRSNIGLQVRTSMVPLADEVTRLFGQPSATLGSDPIDICVVRLDGDAWQRADPGAFLTWPELDHEPSALNRHAFGLIGYPATLQRKAINGRTVTATAYRVLGLECLAKQYRALNCDPTASLLVGFEKRRIWGTRWAQDRP